MDLYYHPSKYVEVIKRLMDIYDLEHRGGGERGSNHHLIKQLRPRKIITGPNPVVQAQ
jgi:hypothetical protein